MATTDEQRRDRPHAARTYADVDLGATHTLPQRLLVDPQIAGNMGDRTLPLKR